ncbi:unnamed protein product [Calicophoron daubneyi]|uniref:Band 7 domain-containing protein n=1 Tax=Calicophoron daubneyi TaxID=300641 RepID=A0AAV2TYA8_CALDB
MTIGKQRNSRHRLKGIFRTDDNSKSPLDSFGQSKRYVFSYEPSDAEAGPAFNFGPFYEPEEKSSKSGTEKQSLFDFSPAFEFGGDRVINDDEDLASQYKTIFTYSAPLSGDILQTDVEALNEWQSKSARGRLHYFLTTLSILLLLLFFPFLCWIFIKHLSQTERVVVFRLGKRLKAKGPGWVILLPFCDRYHLISLDEQTVKIKPVSGGTEDEAIVEVHCSVVYRLVDPDYAYASFKESPSKLVNTQAQLCVLSALRRLPWEQLDRGGARQDLAADAMGTLNFRCGTCGIQIQRLDVDELRLIRGCPPPEEADRLKMSIVKKQIQAITSMFTRTTVRPPVGANFQTTPDGSNTNKATSVGEKSTSKPEANGGASSNQRSSSLPINSPKVEVNDKELSVATLLPMTASRAAETACNQAIARAQPFLNSEAACMALGRTCLQLLVSSGELLPTIPEVNDAAQDSGLTLVYFDAKNGRAALGALPSAQTPDVTVYLTAADLSAALAGTLDMMDAIDKQKIRMNGDRHVLNKLRHLLYLQQF